MGAAVERNRLLQELAAFCEAHPIDEKILLVPSFAVGTQVLDALARSGCAHLNLRPATLRSLALGLVGPELAQAGTRLLSRAQALALVEEASDEALASGSYFRDLRTRPGLHRALHVTLGELERAGLPIDRLPPEAFEDRRKAAELASVRRSLRALLERNAFATPDDVLARASTRARKGAHAFGTVLFLRPEDLELATIEEDLVSHLAGARLTRLAVDAAGFAFASRAGILPATGEENEVRALLRRIVAEEIPFDHVEITSSEATTYDPLLFELFEEHGVPATFQDGLPASSSRPGRGALAFLEWFSEGFPARVLATALADGLIELSSVRPSGARAGSGRLARLLLRARVFRGRGRYLSRLGALRSRGETGPGDDDAARPPEAAAILFDLVKNLLELAPLPEAPLSLPDAARATGAFLSKFARIAAPRDGQARDALLGLCGELAGLPERSLPAGEAAARLSEAIRELAVGGQTPLPGRLHVAPLDAAGHAGRPLFWVLGLDEARFPGAPRQDPVLLDHERKRLGEMLPGVKLALRGADAGSRARHALLSALARTRGEIVLSFSERDLLEDADRFPSAFLLEAFRAKASRKDADYGELRKAIGTAESFVPRTEAALDEGEWWLSALREDPDPSTHRPDVHRAYPGLGEAARAEEARSGTEFTAWDGRVEVAGELDPRAGELVVSASRLERLAACPRAYFFKDVLNLSVPEEERPAGVWLQPYEFGNLLHELFHDFLGMLTARGERPGSSALPALEAAAVRHLAGWRERVPPPTEASFEAQREELLTACAILLAGEEHFAADTRPRFFEVPFGMPGDDLGPAGSAAPVEVDIASGRFRLRGRIDRIDESDGGRWSVWDYKSGSQRRFRDETALDRGRRLQHVLYARAAESLLLSHGENVKTVEGGYIFPTRRGTGWRFVPPPLSKSRVDGVLTDLLDLTANGAFVHSPDEEDCRYCDFREICGDVERAAERAGGKLADESNESLQPFRVLRGSRD